MSFRAAQRAPRRVRSLLAAVAAVALILAAAATPSPARTTPGAIKLCKTTTATFALAVRARGTSCATANAVERYASAQDFTAMRVAGHSWKGTVYSHAHKRTYIRAVSGAMTVLITARGIIDPHDGLGLGGSDEGDDSGDSGVQGCCIATIPATEMVETPYGDVEADKLKSGQMAITLDSLTGNRVWATINDVLVQRFAPFAMRTLMWNNGHNAMGNFEPDMAESLGYYTGVVMDDGTVKLAMDVQVGDKLMSGGAMPVPETLTKTGQSPVAGKGVVTLSINGVTGVLFIDHGQVVVVGELGTPMDPS